MRFFLSSVNTFDFATSIFFHNSNEVIERVCYGMRFQRRLQDLTVLYLVMTSTVMFYCDLQRFILKK